MTATVTIQNADNALINALKSVIRLYPQARVSVKKTQESIFSAQETSEMENDAKAVRQAKAMMAFNSMRERACENGFMSDEEIMAEINAARRGE